MSPKPKPIDADVILDAAADLIEKDGVEAFSMRGLAERIGVAVTSIYWHVGAATPSSTVWSTVC